MTVWRKKKTVANPGGTAPLYRSHELLLIRSRRSFYWSDNSPQLSALSPSSVSFEAAFGETSSVLNCESPCARAASAGERRVGWSETDPFCLGMKADCLDAPGNQ